MNILPVISGLYLGVWIFLICLSFPRLAFISTVKSSWRHIWALIFAQSHVGWTQGELVRRVREKEEQKREGKQERKTERRTEPSPKSIWQKQGAGLTLTTFDMWKLGEEKDAETTAKQEGGKNNKRREAAIISPLCGCLFYIFNKEINAHFKCVRWATICRHALMCLLQPPLKFCTSSRNKGNKIRG